jgi:hypothetical protein
MLPDRGCTRLDVSGADGHLTTRGRIRTGPLLAGCLIPALEEPELSQEPPLGLTRKKRAGREDWS